jgi:phosphonate transport system ATP-binding protein
MLAIEGLEKRYGAVRALGPVSLAIEPGSFVGIVGRSGAGKSTLLRCLNRMIEPSAGRVAWRGGEVSGLRGAALRGWRGRCAMIFQQFNLSSRLDVFANVLVGRIGHVAPWRGVLGAWPRADRELALAALERVDMADFATRRAGTLSGGQQQRVAIARALAQQPDIILADEPVASLDPRSTTLVMDTLAAARRDLGLTVLCNLHHVDLARRYCDRVVGLSGGSVVFDGTPDAFTQEEARRLYGIDEDVPQPTEEVS